MIRRPPRSTLFPYHDALPISGFVEVLPGCTGILPGVFQVAFTPLFAGFLHLLPGFLSVLTGSAKILFTLRSEEHTSELQSLAYLVCRLLLEKKKKKRHAHS